MKRRSFLKKMRDIGFAKSQLQMARNGLTYYHKERDIMVTIPKGHEQTVMISGSGDFGADGLWTTSEVSWGKYVSPEVLKNCMCENILELIYRIFAGDVVLQEQNA